MGVGHTQGVLASGVRVKADAHVGHLRSHLATGVLVFEVWEALCAVGCAIQLVQI